MKQEVLTQEELKELLHYDTYTGVFTRKKTTSSRSFKGAIAGWSQDGGYLRISIGKRRYLLHRLAFLFVDGYFPEHEVDHMNGDIKDNRWSNLRHVSHACNMQNRVRCVVNKTGFAGTYYCEQKDRFRAQIRINQKTIDLGSYKSALEAALARLTHELWDDRWMCNSRGELVKQIKQAWPEFNDRCAR